VHSVAFAPREQLAGGFLDSVTREGFQVAHDISSYSLAALAKAARPMMLGRPGAIVTMSYLGAVRSVPSYNVMGLAKASLEANVRFLAADLGPQGIRVNAISAGPIKTLAAAGVSGFRKMLHHVRRTPPCGATSPSRKSATPRRSSAPTWRRASRGKCCTWMRDTATWEWRFRKGMGDRGWG